MTTVRDILFIIISEPKETSYTCHSDRYWPVGDGF